MTDSDGDEWFSKHKLPFTNRIWKPAMWPLPGDFFEFRIGTCEGLWQSTERTYDILAVTNSEPGNGHFEDVLQWFARSCVRDNKDLRFLEVWNEQLKRHLINVRQFKVEVNTNNVIKKCKYL